MFLYTDREGGADLLPGEGERGGVPADVLDVMRLVYHHYVIAEVDLHLSQQSSTNLTSLSAT
jgi:hypothetical protein